MELTVPGKVFFYGGYSVLLKGHVSLSLAVVDEDGKGVTATYSTGERRIVSKEFGIDTSPSLEDGYLVSFPYVVTETYLRAKGKWSEDVSVELMNSPIFGDKEEKSGLGSSAAATVAVVRALLEANGIDSRAHIETVHKLSQMAYAMYAKKIGSGFDIATSSYGRTIVYRRYDPEEVILPDEGRPLEEAVLTTVDKPWGWLSVRPVDVPADLVVFNIRGAKTSTISAVKAWKEWKKERPEDFKRLMDEQNEVEEMAIDALLRGDYERVREYTHRAREVHRRMQAQIGEIVSDFDPIEPEPLTQLIDRSEALDGVIAGRCPGAGGWDSVAFLIQPGSRVDVDRIVDIGKEVGLDLKIVRVRLF